jgi:hypothetical protein
MVYWTKRDEELRLCNEWLKNPLINPETGHGIVYKGPTYKNWEDRCKKMNLKLVIKNVEINKNICGLWQQNPSINPLTGRKIKIDGPAYLKLQKKCGDKNMLENSITLLGNYYIPDKNGMVPCVYENNRLYVVRTLNDRRIWGPLNKPAKNIHLEYYADTWDYKNGHFKPIFIGIGKKGEAIKTNIQKQNNKSILNKYNDSNIDKFIKTFVTII